MRPKQFCAPKPTPTPIPSLNERIARLRRRRTALSQLIDSLTEYAQYAGQESDLTYECHLYDLARRLPAESPRTHVG